MLGHIILKETRIQQYPHSIRPKIQCKHQQKDGKNLKLHALGGPLKASFERSFKV
jgi:hypothetical protein